MSVESEKCITFWLQAEMDQAFRRETDRLGLTKSQVMRQLIKRWLVQRREAFKAGKESETFEEVM
jgi:hypothetical protein